MESRPTLRPWKADDPLEAVRLESMQDLAASAQLTAASANIHLHKSPNGYGTSIMVDTGSTGRVVERLGQYKGMLHGMVSDSQDGYDFIEATAPF